MPFRISWERSWRWVAVLIAACLFALALTRSTAGDDTVQATLSQKAGFISLVPGITETLVALEETEALVGRSDWCVGPEAVERLPSMGSLLTPNLESIALVQPATVLADGSAAAGLDDLSAIARVEVLPWLRAAEVASSVRRLGEMLGREEPSERLAEDFDALAKAQPEEDAPRVLLALQGSLQQGEVWYIRPHSLHGEALAMAGYRNAVEEPISGPPVLSLERLLQLSPDAIVVLSALPVTEHERAQWIEQWSVFSTLEAVKGGKVTVLGGAETLSTGPLVLNLPKRLRESLRSMGVDRS